MSKEIRRATWEKRFMQTHYSYRDFHTVLTGADAEAANATYIFGTNARAISKDNWPNVGDSALSGRCYARSIMVRCTQDAWAVVTSRNPRYLILLSQGYSAAQIANFGVAQNLTEVPFFLPALALITIDPTYAIQINYYQDTVSGTISIWAEGNVEGTE